MKYVALLMALTFGSSRAAAQDAFDLRFDHTTVLVSDVEASAAFYGGILHLREIDTPWGPTAPIRFYSLGGSRQLHVGELDKRMEPAKNLHLAFSVRDLDAYLGFLRGQGIEYSDFAGSSDQPQVRPDGVRQVYLQDPDGNWIEINDAAYRPS